MAQDLLEHVAKEMELDDLKEITTFRGSDPEGVRTSHPFLPRESLVILGEHRPLRQAQAAFTLHLATARKTSEVGLRYDLPVLAPVNEHGVLTEEAGPYAGLIWKPQTSRLLQI